LISFNFLCRFCSIAAKLDPPHGKGQCGILHARQIDKIAKPARQLHAPHIGVLAVGEHGSNNPAIME
jgi:hypothetical protein